MTLGLKYCGSHLLCGAKLSNLSAYVKHLCIRRRICVCDACLAPLVKVCAATTPCCQCVTLVTQWIQSHPAVQSGQQSHTKQRVVSLFQTQIQATFSGSTVRRLLPSWEPACQRWLRLPSADTLPASWLCLPAEAGICTLDQGTLQRSCAAEGPAARVVI